MQKKVNLETVLGSLSARLTAAGQLTQTKVLPGPRGRIMRELGDANLLVEAIRELALLSGAGTRLGFIETPEGLRPAQAPPGKEPGDDGTNEGSAAQPDADLRGAQALPA